MVYRHSWIAALIGLGFAFFELNQLLRPTGEGLPWQFVVIAGGALGLCLTWAALVYRLPAWAIIVINGLAMVITVTRVSTPDTSRYLLPTTDSFATLDQQLSQALNVIRSGIEPVQPITGIVIVLMVVAWLAGIIVSWGMATGHPYVALVPPLVLTLQFATMNRGPSNGLELFTFVALVAGSILAVATDERAQTAGRMAPRGAWPTHRATPTGASVGLLGITVVGALVAVQTFQGVAPPDGWLDWRDERGLGTGYYGSVSYNPFVSIQQSLLNPSDVPVLQARITGDVPAEEVYFQLVTMDTYNGGQFFAQDTALENLEEFPYENPDHAFAGPTAEIEAEIQIERLRQEWLPSTYAVAAVAADPDIRRDLRIRPDDGSLVWPGGLSYEGMRYRVTSAVPRPDLDVLASIGNDLSPAFAAAREQAVADGVDISQLPTPTPAPLIREAPPDVERFRRLPDDNEVTRITQIRALAFEQTGNLGTDFEKALALESWFHSTFEYKLLTRDEIGHGADDLAAWLLDEDSPNYRAGYCENFATAMGVMARTIGIPSRVVLGFTPGEPNAQDPEWVVVRDRNAHAWVELWMPSQGWVRFDPTPRGTEVDTVQTFAVTNEELGFDITPYLDVPDSAFNEPDPGGTGAPGIDPADIDPPPPNNDGAAASGGFGLPGWLTTIAFWGVVLALVLLTVPGIKWWQRRRRMARLRDGDITAAWEEIVARLDDLGDPVRPVATPTEAAEAVDPAMRPLAVTYGRAVYGPEGAVNADHVETATRSLEQTNTMLNERYSAARRTMAWYRPGSLLPPELRQRLRRRRR